jgi:hypothetical protein
VTRVDLETPVIDLAHALGWLVAHFRPAQTMKGWRTAVSADGKGFPDLVLVKGTRLIFAEVKAGGSSPTLEQRAWLTALAGTGVETYVWTLKDWQAGTVEQVLRVQP